MVNIFNSLWLFALIWLSDGEGISNYVLVPCLTLSVTFGIQDLFNFLKSRSVFERDSLRIEREFEEDRKQALESANAYLKRSGLPSLPSDKFGVKTS